MKVIFKGASDEQVRFATGGSDPRMFLTIGQEYTLEHRDIYDWHTQYHLVGFPGIWFNSVCFEEVN